MRTGFDVRRHRKPSVFVELVDTRWDEYNRVAEMNLIGTMVDPRAVVTPGSFPNSGGMPLPGTTVVPPAMLPGAPQDCPTDGGRHSEPNLLPGAPPEPLPPPPGVGSTAQLPSTAGPQLDAAPANDAVDEVQPVEAEGAEKVKLSSFVGVPCRRSSKTSDRAGDLPPEAPQAARPARRPALSRLFSR